MSGSSATTWSLEPTRNHESIAESRLMDQSQEKADIYYYELTLKELAELLGAATTDKTEVEIRLYYDDRPGETFSGTADVAINVCVTTPEEEG